MNRFVTIAVRSDSPAARAIRLAVLKTKGHGPMEPDLVASQPNTRLTAVRYGRRAASPCRLTLAAGSGRGLDGAWWPHSPSIARELPDLIDALTDPLGQIVDIGVNWSRFEGVPELDLLNQRGVAATPGRESRRLRLMDIAGTQGSAKLLIVPFRTTPALAVMLLRLAARLSVLSWHQHTSAFHTAEAIVNAACDQPH